MAAPARSCARPRMRIKRRMQPGAETPRAPSRDWMFSSSGELRGAAVAWTNSPAYRSKACTPTLARLNSPCTQRAVANDRIMPRVIGTSHQAVMTVPAMCSRISSQIAAVVSTTATRRRRSAGAANGPGLSAQRRNASSSARLTAETSRPCAAKCSRQTSAGARSATAPWRAAVSAGDAGRSNQSRRVSAPATVAAGPSHCSSDARPKRSRSSAYG